MSLLKIANLKKNYNITKTQKQEVLKGIDIEFKSGDLVALLGESGCGKSTLINILGGLDTDYTGSVIIKGDFIREYSEKQMDDYRKKRVGLIFQNYNLIGHMTLKENVEIAMEISNIDKTVRSERALELLHMVGLKQMANKLPSQLSGGQKQRVAIARALANNPTILLADEPTGALDKESADMVLKILKKIAQSGKLVIIVTHSPKVAEECSRIVKIDDGIIVSDQTTNKLHIDTERDKEIKPKNISLRGIFSLALHNIKHNFNRSALVSVGLSIGIAAVVLILCLSSGLTNYVNQVYKQNLQSLQITVSKDSDRSFSSSDISTVENLDGVSYVLTGNNIAATYTYQTQTASISNLSVYFSSFYPDLLYGEISTNAQSVLINETLANELTDQGLIACVGNTIELKFGSNTQTVTITGIYDDQTDSYESNNALTTSTVLNNLYQSSYYNRMFVTVSDVTYVSGVLSDLQMLGYTTFQADTSAKEILSYIDLGTNILTGVSAISMLIAAIMIFIVLYISVVERMKEIGIMRAIGARKKDIRQLFLVEAGGLGLGAGLMGVALCIVLSVITNMVCLSTLSYALISYHIGYYVLGIFISICISILAGIAPAVRAANLDPVDCLRYE